MSRIFSTSRSDLVAKGSRNLRTDNDTKKSWDSRTDEQKAKEEADAKRKAEAEKKSPTYQEPDPLVLHQYTLGSCVGNATTATFAYELQRANAHLKNQKSGTWFLPSRTFIYYNARQAMNQPVMEDKGCYNRNAMKSLHKLGVVPEEVLPYPFNPREADHYFDTEEIDIKKSCKAHLEKLSAGDVFGAFMFTSGEADKAKQPFDQATVKKAEELKSKNEMEKLKSFCMEYILSLKAGQPKYLLNWAWYDVLRKAAQVKSALYPGIDKYLAAKYFRIAG